MTMPAWLQLAIVALTWSWVTALVWGYVRLEQLLAEVSAAVAIDDHHPDQHSTAPPKPPGTIFGVVPAPQHLWFRQLPPAPADLSMVSAGEGRDPITWGAAYSALVDTNGQEPPV